MMIVIEVIILYFQDICIKKQTNSVETNPNQIKPKSRTSRTTATAKRRVHSLLPSAYVFHLEDFKLFNNFHPTRKTWKTFSQETRRQWPQWKLEATPISIPIPYPLPSQSVLLSPARLHCEAEHSSSAPANNFTLSAMQFFRHISVTQTWSPPTHPPPW